MVVIQQRYVTAREVRHLWGILAHRNSDTQPADVAREFCLLIRSKLAPSRFWPRGGVIASFKKNAAAAGAGH
jgi:hypothetical protein